MHPSSYLSKWQDRTKPPPREFPSHPSGILPSVGPPGLFELVQSRETAPYLLIEGNEPSEEDNQTPDTESDYPKHLRPRPCRAFPVGRVPIDAPQEQDGDSDGDRQGRHLQPERDRQKLARRLGDDEDHARHSQERQRAPEPWAEPLHGSPERLVPSGPSHDAQGQ